MSEETTEEMRQELPARSQGVMDAGYSSRRKKVGPLAFRYRTRALAALVEFERRKGKPRMERVLELGAADGLTLLEIRRLLSATGEFHGVELSTDLLFRCPKDVPGLRVIHGDVMALPKEIPAAHYTLVTALALLEHLDEPARCVTEAVRVLKPGGVFVATCPNPFWDGMAGRLGLVEDDFHVHRLNAEALIRLFEDAGLEDVTFTPFMWVPIAFLPYLRLPVPPQLGLSIDRAVGRLGRWTSMVCVNQLVAGNKPENNHDES